MTNRLRRPTLATSRESGHNSRVAPSMRTVTLPPCSSNTPAVAWPSGSTISFPGSLPNVLAPSWSQLGNLQRLLAIVGLRDQQVVHINAQPSGVNRIEGVLGIHKGCHAALLLRFGDDLQRNRGFARGFRPENFNHASADRKSATQGGIEGDRARGNDCDGNHRFLGPQLHDRAL